MTPMQKRRIEQLIDRGQYIQARMLLKKLTNDQDAQAMLAEMAIAYPETGLERANEASKRILLYVFVGVVALIALVLLIGLIQFIQAQAAL